MVFSEIYHGEIYDAALEISDWSLWEKPEGTWHEIKTVPFDASVLRTQSGSRVKMIDEMPVIELFTTPKGRAGH